MNKRFVGVLFLILVGQGLALFFGFATAQNYGETTRNFILGQQPSMTNHGFAILSMAIVVFSYFAWFHTKYCN